MKYSCQQGMVYWQCGENVLKAVSYL